MPVEITAPPDYDAELGMFRGWFSKADHELSRAVACGQVREAVERLAQKREHARRGLEGVLVRILAGNVNRVEREQLERQLEALNTRAVLADTIRCAHTRDDLRGVAAARQPLPVHEDEEGFYTTSPEVAATVLMLATAKKVADVVVVEVPGTGTARRWGAITAVNGEEQ